MDEKVVYIGIDYHKNSFTAAFLDSVTGVLITKKYKEIKNFQEDILKYRRRIQSKNSSRDTNRSKTLHKTDKRG